MIFPLQPLTVFLVILYLIHSAPVTLELNYSLHHIKDAPIS